MTALIVTVTHWDHLAKIYAERERRGMWRPAPFRFPAKPSRQETSK